MRALLTILLMIYAPASVPEQSKLEWWQTLGEPCSTVTDRDEKTCGELGIKSEIVWR
jgi:hypothetical protein